MIYCYHYICFTLSLVSDIYVSQGSVATFVRCSRIFNYSFIINLLLSQLAKKVENRLAFGEVAGKSIAVPFFRTRCIVSSNLLSLLL